MEAAELYKIFLTRKYDKNKPLPAQQILLTIKTAIIGTIQSFVIISGAPKTGKSTFTSALIGSFALPHFQDNFGIKLKGIKDRQRMCYIDTETSQYDFYKQIDRIKAFSLRDNLSDKIDCFNVREDAPADIKQFIEVYLANNKDCSILVIDGILDLCLNYNDEIETRLLINWFKKITKVYNILLIGILHTSKSNGESLGHLGSNTDRWAQSTLLVERNKESNQLTLKAKFLRSAADFEPIALMNLNGTWHETDYLQDETKKGRK